MQRKIAVAKTITTIDTSHTPKATIDTVSEAKKVLMQNMLPLWKTNIDYTTFTGKAKMHYVGKDGQKQEFTAHFRMKKDSIVWVSITALGGIGVARVCITPDSVLLLVYMDKEATCMPFSKANSLLPANVDFSFLQNLIIGNVLRRDCLPMDANDKGDIWEYQLQNTQYKEQITYGKTDSNMHINQLHTINNDNVACMILYSNYDTLSGRKFSYSRQINFTNKDNSQYYIDMEFKNITFDTPLDFPFSIPKNYTRKE